MKTPLKKLGAIATVATAAAMLPVTGFGQSSPTTTTRGDLTRETTTTDRGDHSLYGWVGLLGLLGLAGLTRKRDSDDDNRTDAARRRIV